MTGTSDNSCVEVTLPRTKKILDKDALAQRQEMGVPTFAKTYTTELYANKTRLLCSLLVFLQKAMKVSTCFYVSMLTYM